MALGALTQSPLAGGLDRGSAKVVAPIKDKSALGRMMDKNLDQQFDIFMKMFLAQVKCQDPTKPMSTNEMTENILGFFTAAEHAKGNQLLEQMNTTKSREQLAAAKTYLNKDVVYEAAGVHFTGEPQTFNVDLPSNVDRAEFAIIDQQQRVVKTVSLDPGTQHHKVTWGGEIEGLADLKAPPGYYSLKVLAQDAKERLVDVPVLMQGIVNAVDYNEGNDFQLVVNDTAVPLEDVVSVRKGANHDGQLLGTVQDIHSQLKGYEEMLRALQHREKNETQTVNS